MLCFHPGRSTFVDKDIAIFQETFEVKEFFFNSRNHKAIPLILIRQFLFLIRHIGSSKVYIAEFAGYHSFLPALFSKLGGPRLLIISAGTDAASYPSIHYGNYHKRIYGTITRWSFRLCSHISPVHKSLIRWENHFYTQDGHGQGIFHHVPGLKKPYTVIPYGYDGEKWAAATYKRQLSFITVAFIQSPITYKLKGIDLILEIAERFHDCTFTIIGMTYQPPRDIPPNVQVIGKLPNEALIAHYKEHEFYFQLSLTEGHPNALCEAMLCNCIPIGSAITSIPDLIGDSGFILKHRNIDELESLMKEALASPRKDLAIRARNQIKDNYPFTRRKQEMLELLQTLAK